MIESTAKLIELAHQLHEAKQGVLEAESALDTAKGAEMGVLAELKNVLEDSVVDGSFTTVQVEFIARLLLSTKKKP